MAISKRHVFRLLLVVVPLALFGIGEVGLRLADIGNPAMMEDPFMGFERTYRLYGKTKLDGRLVYRTNPNRTGDIPGAFRDEVFPSRKEPGTIRIFCLGESSTYGWGVKKEEAFPFVLASLLRERIPQVNFEVVNAGGCGYASYRIRLIALELLEYEPDVFILYVGHNEFVEKRIYQEVGPPGVIRSALVRSYLFNTLRSGVRRVKFLNSKPVLPFELDEGMMVRDETQMRLTYEHYRYCVEEIVREARKRKVAVILATPASNLYVVPNTLKFAPREPLSEHYLRGLRAYADSRFREAAEEFRKAVAASPSFAGSHWYLGLALEALGEKERAREELVRSRDTDAFPERATSATNNILREIAKAYDVPLVDVEREFLPLDSSDLFLEGDNVHLTPRGHRLLAELLASRIIRERLVEAVSHEI